MANENRKKLGGFHVQDYLDMSSCTVNSGSIELSEDNKRMMHYLVKMYHSKYPIIVCGAET